SVTRQPSPDTSVSGNGRYQSTARVLPPGSEAAASLWRSRLFGFAAVKRWRASSRTASRLAFPGSGEGVFNIDQILDDFSTIHHQCFSYFMIYACISIRVQYEI